ncbi:uncharacterized protein LOC129891359 isoform X2 [Solanum dulcamara]|uniref:uncharacterized protein LOC129891359 isoform X2 n=1 Tax=Solanum dulcamara TaxID=45834 RepID=UPI0024859EA9|nr:uncharacterized protein LOC129891359 isoform X2 [Solanum dulcamara]XP_055822664.1 uncharacterized protein LOC129891359 isoform X2 [Solanum dulcamara]
MPERETVPPTASSATPPEIMAAPGENQRADSPVFGAPAPEPLAPQPRAEERAMQDAVQLLTSLVAGQEHRRGLGGDQVQRPDSSRAREFLTCNPPEFFGTKPEEDPQEFIREMQRTLRLIKASTTESVELASYRLLEVAANWYESWELSRGRLASPAIWDEFTEAFISHFLPPEMRRARVDRFLQLKQRGRSIREYSLEFDSLAQHAHVLVADMTDRMHRYVMGLDRYLVDSCLVMAAQPGMDIARIQAYAQGMEERHKGHQSRQPKKARSTGYSGELRGRPYQQQSSGQSTQPTWSMPPQSVDRRSGGTGYSAVGSSFKVSSSQLDRGSGQTRPPRPQCSYCGKYHLGECYRATGACFSCGSQSHMMRDCPYKGGLADTERPTGSVAGSSSSSVAMRPTGQGISTPAGRGRGRGGVSSSSGPSNRLYSLATRQDQEASPDGITDFGGNGN